MVCAPECCPNCGSQQLEFLGACGWTEFYRCKLCHRDIPHRVEPPPVLGTIEPQNPNELSDKDD